MEHICPFSSHFAGPTLTHPQLCAEDPLADVVEAFAERCPNMMTFRVHHSFQDPTQTIFANVKVSRLICRWSNLRVLYCKGIPLSAAELLHLSQTPIQLLHGLTLSGPALLTFPTLVRCEVYSTLLAVLWRLSHRLRLPGIEQVHVLLESCPTELELKCFLATLRDACRRQSLTNMTVNYYPRFIAGQPYHINFHHLCPLTAFANIRIIHLKIPCGVSLSERELLELASSWPRLQTFNVGRYHPRRIRATTQTMPIAHPVQLRVRYQCYTEIPQGHPWNGLEMLDDAVIDVRHSAIEEASIEALAVFFHVAPFPNFLLGFSLEGYSYRDVSTLRVYHDRWKRVTSLARSLSEKNKS